MNPASNSLRDPDSKTQEFSLNPAEVFEHPAGISTGYVLQSPYEAQRIQTVKVKAGGTCSAWDLARSWFLTPLPSTMANDVTFEQ